MKKDTVSSNSIPTPNEDSKIDKTINQQQIPSSTDLQLSISNVNSTTRPTFTNISRECRVVSSPSSTSHSPNTSRLDERSLKRKEYDSRPHGSEYKRRKFHHHETRIGTLQARNNIKIKYTRTDNPPCIEYRERSRSRRSDRAASTHDHDRSHRDAYRSPRNHSDLIYKPEEKHRVSRPKYREGSRIPLSDAQVSSSYVNSKNLPSSSSNNTSSKSQVVFSPSSTSYSSNTSRLDGRSHRINENDSIPSKLKYHETRSRHHEKSRSTGSDRAPSTRDRSPIHASRSPRKFDGDRRYRHGERRRRFRYREDSRDNNYCSRR